MSTSQTTRVFIAYSRSDTVWLRRLQVHLKPLVRTHSIELWDDTRLRPGMEWRREIDLALSTATIAVLLVSANFLASDFIINNELPPLLDGAARRGMRILSAILGPCLYLHHHGLSKYQSLNPPERPFVAMPEYESEEHLVRLAETIIQYAALPPPPVSTVSNGETRSSYPADGEKLDPSRFDRMAASSTAPGNASVLQHLRFETEQLPTTIAHLLRVRGLGDNPTPSAELSSLEGAWIEDGTDTCLFGRVVHGHLHHVYCYGGNEKTIGTYFDWTKLGSTWFSRFRWIDGTWHGFGLHTFRAPDLIEGIWWGAAKATAEVSPHGEHILWRRVSEVETPAWATEYFAALHAKQVK